MCWTESEVCWACGGDGINLSNEKCWCCQGNGFVIWNEDESVFPIDEG